MPRTFLTGARLAVWLSGMVIGPMIFAQTAVPPVHGAAMSERQSELTVEQLTRIVLEHNPGLRGARGGLPPRWAGGAGAARPHR